MLDADQNDAAACLRFIIDVGTAKVVKTSIFAFFKPGIRHEGWGQELFRSNHKSKQILLGLLVRF